MLASYLGPTMLCTRCLKLPSMYLCNKIAAAKEGHTEEKHLTLTDGRRISWSRGPLKLTLNTPDSDEVRGQNTANCGETELQRGEGQMHSGVCPFNRSFWLLSLLSSICVTEFGAKLLRGANTVQTTQRRKKLAYWRGLVGGGPSRSTGPYRPRSKSKSWH